MFLFIQIPSSMGSELKILTIKEFQKIEEAKIAVQTNLSEFEIDNRDFIELKKISPTMKTAITFNKTKISKVHIKQ